jgi:hypothetical protein
MKHDTVILVTGLIVLFLTARLSAETAIHGTVADFAGNPVAHAYVEAIPVATTSAVATVGNGSNPWVAADNDGNFQLSLEPGRYRIRAKDEADGYPDPSFWVNLDPRAKFPVITVGNEQLENVKVVLGAQGAILSGRAQDSETNKPLVGVKIRIQDARNPPAYLEIFTGDDGHFQYVVASKPLLISATVRGYESFSFEHGAEITLMPGEHREFLLEMRRRP